MDHTDFLSQAAQHLLVKAKESIRNGRNLLDLTGDPVDLTREIIFPTTDSVLQHEGFAKAFEDLQRIHPAYDIELIDITAATGGRFKKHTSGARIHVLHK